MRTGMGKLWDWLISVLGDSGAAGNRNRIHNGNFQVNQRAVSGTVTLAAGAYGHDRWKAGSGGCTYTFAASGKDIVVNITAGSLLQVIEDKDVEGGQYRLSHTGTAQARISVNGAAPSGAYAAAPLTSAAATGGQSMTVEFGTGTVSKVQLEPGTVETAFERRPYATELALCQRHYETGSVSMRGYQVGGGAIYYFCNFKVPKRSAAGTTITFSGTSLLNASSILADSITTDGFRPSATASTSGDTLFLVNFVPKSDL